MATGELLKRYDCLVPSCPLSMRTLGDFKEHMRTEHPGYSPLKGELPTKRG